ISIKSLEQELNVKIFERSSNGIYLTEEGSEFVRYAAQLVDSEDLVTGRYRDRGVASKLRIATQHYDFIADVFGNFLKDVDAARYQFAIKEIETYNVIREVQTGNSDIGVIAIKDNDFDIMKRYLGKQSLSFTPFLTASPHAFVRRSHPLAASQSLGYCELQAYPYVSYGQGEHNSSYFTEEMLDALGVDKHVEISDRATLMNLLMITDAYTVGTGIMPSALNKGDIVSIPLECEDRYVIGYILNENRKISEMTAEFIRKLEGLGKDISKAKGERE
ncbi:MAG: LysR family transcriptional regulator, partial [Clostridia bacterium]|nr:LysR family transcriptional regulator [Clostridia bacterium]